VTPLKTVKKALKAQGNCSKCGAELPVGGSYRYYRRGFRGPKIKVCMKSECTPKESERENTRMSTVYEAQESAREAIDAAETVAELESALEQAADTAREVLDDYQQSMDSSPTLLEQKLMPKIEALEDFASECESVVFDEGDEGFDEDEKYQAEVLEANKDLARDAISSLEV
jgi:hypothetical protein